MANAACLNCNIQCHSAQLLPPIPIKENCQLVACKTVAKSPTKCNTLQQRLLLNKGRSSSLPRWFSFAYARPLRSIDEFSYPALSVVGPLGSPGNTCTYTHTHTGIFDTKCLKLINSSKKHYNHSLWTTHNPPKFTKCLKILLRDMLRLSKEWQHTHTHHLN